jgi:hypothetical protein
MNLYHRPILPALLALFLLNACSKPQASGPDGGPAFLMAPYRDGDLWGFAKPDGSILIEPAYESAWVYADGFGRMTDPSFMGLVSPEGKLLLKPQYNFIGFFSEGRAVFQDKNGAYGYIDETGAVVIAPVYENAEDFKDGVAIVKKNDQNLLIRPDGALVKSIGQLDRYHPDPYEGMFASDINYDPGFIPVTQAENYLAGLIDKDGNTVLKPVYEHLSRPQNGVLIAQMGGKYGLIRTDGSELTPRKYSYMELIAPGLYTAMNENERHGLINEKGETVLPFEYSYISSAGEGLFITARDEKSGIIDRKGAVIVPFEYNSLYPRMGVLVAFDGQGKAGIVSMKNEIVVPFEYENLEILRADRFLADKGGKRGLIDNKGKIILPFEHTLAYIGEDSFEYFDGMERPRHSVILFKDGAGTLYNLDGKRLSDKKWLYHGYPDVFGLIIATDANGRMNFVGPNGMIYAKDAPVKKKTVSTAQELFDAIGDDSEITLADGQYDLGKVNGGSAHAQIFDFGFDDRTVVIRNAKNLHIKAQNPGKAEIVTAYAYVPVLRLEDCSNITLAGLKMGHNVEPGHCDGAVIAAEIVSYLQIENCDLYGSGTVGLEAVNSSNIVMRNTTVRECTAGILSLQGCYSSAFYNCEFTGNNGYAGMVITQYSHDVLFRDCRFRDNHASKDFSPTWFFQTEENYPSITLENCSFENCTAGAFANNPEAVVEVNVSKDGF